MKKFSIREVRLPSGEIVPTLVEGHPLGQPVALALRYVLTSCRPSGKKANTIRQKLRALALCFNFLEQRKIELVERAANYQFLSLEELVALSEYCRLTQDSIKIVNPSYAASRYATCIDFVQWISEPVLARIDNPRRRDSSNIALKRFLKKAKSTAPPSKGYQSYLPGARLGFTPEQRALLLDCILPASVGNPFGEKLQFRNYVMLYLAFTLGPRSGELIGLKVRDIDFSDRPASLTIHRRHDDKEDTRLEPPATKTLGRLLLLSDYSRDLLDEWITKHRSNKTAFPEAKKHPFLFVNYRGEPISSRGFRLIIETLRRHFPALGKACLHTFRHDFNDRWVEVSADDDQENSVRDQKYHNGWSPTSSMPALYGKRAIQKSSNRRSLALQEGIFSK